MAALRGVALSALSKVRTGDHYAKPLMDWKMDVLQDKGARENYAGHMDRLAALHAEYDTKVKEVRSASQKVVEEVQRTAALTVEASMEPTLASVDAEKREKVVADLQAKRLEILTKKHEIPLYYKIGGKKRRIKPYKVDKSFGVKTLQRGAEERKMELQRSLYALRQEEREGEGRLVAQRDRQAQEVALAKGQAGELRMLLQQSERKLQAMRDSDVLKLKAVVEDSKEYRETDAKEEKLHFSRMEKHNNAHLVTMENITNAAKRKVRAVKAVSRTLECIAAFLLCVACYRVASVLIA